MVIKRMQTDQEAIQTHIDVLDAKLNYDIAVNEAIREHLKVPIESVNKHLQSQIPKVQPKNTNDQVPDRLRELLKLLASTTEKCTTNSEYYSNMLNNGLWTAGHSSDVLFALKDEMYVSICVGVSMFV